MWVLKTEFRSSEKAVSAHKLWAILADPTKNFWKDEDTISKIGFSYEAGISGIDDGLRKSETVQYIFFLFLLSFAFFNKKSEISEEL